MAEVAKNVVSEHERPEPEELSLQQLIDTELALRAPPPNKSQSFTLDFLEAEREAAGRCAPNSPPLIVIDPVVVANGTDSPSPPPTEPFEKKVDDDSKNTKIVEEFSQFINGDVGGGVGEAVGVTDEWTTVEEVALELTGEGGGDRALAEPQPQQPPVATLTELTTSCATNNSDGSTTEIINTTITTQILHEESSKIHQTVICSPSDIETPSTDKKKKKKSVAENGSGANSTAKVKKTKKKKTEEKENHISVKSSFSKFDQLSKKTVLHVRSSDPAKASKTFSQGDSQGTSTCKACDKTVFAMEQIKAERAVWHKNCFRCHTCKKQLTVDIYSSHEGLLYCKPHFKDLFKPKVVVDQDEEPASDKSDLGLKELNLDVKSMFRVFEKSDETDGDLEKSPTTVSVKRSSSIMSKLAKFQKKGMDIGVSEEALNGFVCEETSSSSEEEEEELDEVQENGVVKSTKKLERPMSFGKIDDVKKNWESAGDQHERREKLREQKKEELQNLRSRLFMGKQVKMKELYEQAVAESEGKSVKKDEMSDIVRSEKAKVVREKFEKGEPVHSDSEEESKTNKKGIDEDISIFEEGISKKSRSLFLQMDANVAKITPPPSDVKVKKPKESDSPEREVYRDPDVIRCDEKLEDDTALMKSQTTSRMLSMFRQMEEHKEVLPEGPKPKKCFTPPPDYKASESEESEASSDDDEDEDDDEESETEDGVVKSSYKVDDEYLKQSKNAARAKQLAAKFESWEPDQQSNNNAITMLDSEHASIDSTKSLRAKFESLKSEEPKEKSRPKVNRFVETTAPSMCAFCEAKVYPLEKIETNGKMFHKQCFRCSYCNCILRMDSYTLNNGHLYCLPHFKQLFISKGNYDEGFGSNQHKRKWETPAN